MKLATLKDYAEKTGLPVRTLRRFCQDGALPALRIGRVYYLDEAAADAKLATTVQQETNGKHVRTPEPATCRVKKFDFLKALSEA